MRLRHEKVIHVSVQEDLDAFFACQSRLRVRNGSHVAGGIAPKEEHLAGFMMAGVTGAMRNSE